jgi:prephenate dehydratase
MEAKIKFINKDVVPLLEANLKNSKELLDIIKRKDYEAFEKLFNDVAASINVMDEKREVKVKNPVKHWDKDAIAVLGPRGSYTDAAAEFYRRKIDSGLKVQYASSISEAIDAVKQAKVGSAIIPIENSIQGTVNEALDGINYSGLHIIKEIIMPIHHCIATLPDHGPIDTIMSHPQALTQSSRYIQMNYPDAKIVRTLSTTEAFQMIEQKQLANAVAIGPEIAAELYNLKVVEKGIEDERNNKTKFVLISSDGKTEKDGSMKTSIVVFPSNEKQGLLFNLLKHFNDNKVNLTKIESRPMKDELGKYIFYMDLEGASDDDAVQKALAGIASDIGSVRVLGCYGQLEAE